MCVSAAAAVGAAFPPPGAPIRCAGRPQEAANQRQSLFQSPPSGTRRSKTQSGPKFFCACRQVRNATAVFIINLSVSDLSFCCFNLPLAASLFAQRAWTHGDLLCRLFPLFRYALMAVSLFTVLAITINRYVMIGHPRLYPRLYRRRWLALMVASTWLLGFGALVPTWLGVWGRFGLDDKVGSCTILHDHNERTPKEFLFIVAFVIPCIVIVVCYARIFYIVRKTALKSRGPRGGGSSVAAASANSGGGTAASRKADAALSSSAARAHAVLENGAGAATRLEAGSRPLLLDVPRTAHEPSSSSGIDVSNAGSLCDEDDTASGGGAGAGAGAGSRSGTPTSLSSRGGGRSCGGRRRRRSGRSPSAVALGSALCQVAAVFGRGRAPSGSPCSVRRYSNNNLAAALPTSPPVPGKMTTKDKKLLKMILVIFASFVVCYLPITVSKTFHSVTNLHGLNIAGYILIYLSTCINPIIYVVMSSEYRQAYKNLLMCRASSGGGATPGGGGSGAGAGQQPQRQDNNLMELAAAGTAGRCGSQRA
ncbi:G-protein coupled receptor moody [Schistocerca nitens]|uniref:G-protein coupled receptor moody n=1 Tax=Schistocerca nitens TaxID=7011 RepID=UPI00211914A1|nr:G-protein coupled receptor moody [Schistocerca nitens]